MPRIGGINIPNEKRIIISLSYIYGISLSRSKKILKESNIDENMKAKDITSDQMLRIRKCLQEYNTEGDLRREIQTNVRRLIDIGSYRGIRHKKSLPLRGQRTKTNSRTVRGNKRSTMGSGRRKESKT